MDKERQIIAGAASPSRIDPNVVWEMISTGMDEETFNWIRNTRLGVGESVGTYIYWTVWAGTVVNVDGKLRFYSDVVDTRK